MEDRQYWERRLWWAEYYTNKTTDIKLYRRFEAIRYEALSKLGWW